MELKMTTGIAEDVRLFLYVTGSQLMQKVTCEDEDVANVWKMPKASLFRFRNQYRNYEFFCECLSDSFGDESSTGRRQPGKRTWCIRHFNLGSDCSFDVHLEVNRLWVQVQATLKRGKSMSFQRLLDRLRKVCLSSYLIQGRFELLEKRDGRWVASECITPMDPFRTDLIHDYYSEEQATDETFWTRSKHAKRLLRSARRQDRVDMLQYLQRVEASGVAQFSRKLVDAGVAEDLVEAFAKENDPLMARVEAKLLLQISKLCGPASYRAARGARRALLRASAHDDEIVRKYSRSS